MRKKNILFVVNTLTTGGANSSLSALYAEMKDYYDIKVFALAHDGDVDSHGFREALLPRDKIVDAYFADFAKAKPEERGYKHIMKILKRMCIMMHIDLRKYLYTRSVRKLETKYNFDIVIAFQEDVSAYFVSLFKCNKKVAWVHCDFTKGYANDDATIYEHFNKIVFVSQFTKSTFLNKFPQYEDKSCYVYNFLDDRRIKERSLENVDDFNFDEDNRFVVISIGRILQLKRFSKIPQIVSEIKEAGKEVRWILLGPIFDEAEYSLFETNVHRYKVEDSVYWLGGKSNPYPYLMKSNLCVSLSTTEACPMIFNEARIFGIPIGSTNFGSADEFIDDGVDGFICPIEDMSKKIIQLISSPDKYEKLRQNSGPKYIDNEKIRQSIHNILNN